MPCFRCKLVAFLLLTSHFLSACSGLDTLFGATPPTVEPAPDIAPLPTLELNGSAGVSTALPIGAAANPDAAPTPDLPTPTPLPTLTPRPIVLGTRSPQPTLDAMRGVPAAGTVNSTYTVQRGDTLGSIAVAYDMPVDELKKLNNLRRDLVRIGQTLTIKIPVTGSTPAIKLLPDSELVNGPAVAGLDLARLIDSYPGYLKRYTEQAGGQTLSGADIVARISEQMSVNPRLLLAALEYRGGWLSNDAPSGDQLEYPLGNHKTNTNGLLYQLTWAAARFNEGYYGWKLNNRYIVKKEDDSYAFLSDGINGGTAGVQNWLALATPAGTWTSGMLDDDSPRSFITTYRRLFGDPWQYDTGEPVGPDVRQPELSLPFAKGETWFLTGGPHSAWGRGSPWGAIDFTSISVAGCGALPEWAVAMADGVITRSARGEVVQALDPSGDDRVGWSLLYLHIGTNGRVPVGTRVKRGDRIGHPSCEGGVSDGAHMHLVRRHNGEWVNGTGRLPFVIGGWALSEATEEYDGYLTRGAVRREACVCKQASVNGISW
jgi:LasA protease